MKLEAKTRRVNFRQLATFFFLCCSTLQANIILVDSTASNPAPDGITWETAFPNLQDALAAANPNDEIWVADGTYYPDIGASQTEDATTSRFSLPDGVSMFGGFSGDETLRSERDPGVNRTILSGDLTQDDIDPDGDDITALAADIQGANADVVVYVGNLFHFEPQQIDGFVITAGFSTSYGGGLYSIENSLIVSNCAFHGNRTRYGGGIYIRGRDSVISNCLFSGNLATSDGGGLYIRNDVQCSNLLFVANTAGRYGGAIYTNAGFPVIANCTITGNSALQGGGIYTDSSQYPEICNSIIWNNSASGVTTSAAASSAPSHRSPRFCKSIVANSGTQAWNSEIGVNLGGNIDADPQFILPSSIGQPMLFPKALMPLNGSPAIDSGDNSRLTTDQADLDHDGDKAEIIPLDLANKLRLRGGGLDLGAYESGAGPAIVSAPANLYLEPNAGTQQSALDLSTIFDSSALSYALIASIPEGLLTAVVDSETGIVSITPAPDAIGTTRLVLSATDSTGQTNFISLTIEVFPDVLYVDAAATGTDSGLSWTDAFPNLQDALILGGSGHQIWLAEGVYRPDTGEGQTAGDTSACFTLPPGVSLIGGFQGTESDPNERDLSLCSILSGDIDLNDTDPNADSITDSVSDIVGSNSKTVIEIVDALASARIENLHVTAADSTTETGGGMRIVSSEVTIRRCDFSGNRAKQGGGVSVGTSSAAFENCQFSYNAAYPSGGALWSDDGSLDLKDCIFEGNSVLSTSSSGGAISVSKTTGSCHDSTFTGNQALATFGKGGGVSSSLSTFSFVRCDFTSNAAYEGGAYYIGGGSAGGLLQCRLKGNSATRNGGAIYTAGVDFPLMNCELSGNFADDDGGVIYNQSAIIEITNSTIGGNAAGASGGAIYNRTTNTSDSAKVIMKNSIIWNNLSRGAADTTSASIDDSLTETQSSFSHCLIANSGGSSGWNTELGTDLGNNIDLDPRFLFPSDPALSPTPHSDLRVETFSPVIDAGDTSALPEDIHDIDGDENLTEPLPLDLWGQVRVSQASVDIGSYEHQAGPALVQASSRVRVEPMSGVHPTLFDLSAFFDSTAVNFEIDLIFPQHILTATADPATGLIDIEILPHQYGQVTLIARAENAGGGASLHAIIVDVFPTAFYVDSGATGLATGLTWTDAFTDIQSALAVNRIEGLQFEIWVAEGVYHPDVGPGQAADDPASSFTLVSDAFLYGGFSGNETSREQRDPAAHVVILSGDLAQDDLDADGNQIAETPADIQGANARSIVTCEPGTAGAGIDGFTITAGSAIDTSTTGGALTVDTETFTARQCIFQGNEAIRGGAVRLFDAEINIIDCRFISNRAYRLGSSTTTYGGAIQSENSTLSIVSSAFELNQATGGGGGAINAFGGGTLNLTDCGFISNLSHDDGGAIEIDDVPCVIRSCRFENNSIAAGTFESGGAAIFEDSSCIIIDSEFLGNSATSFGGAVVFSGDSAVTCINTQFRGNQSAEAGGAVHSVGLAAKRFTNCLFTGNNTRTNGGAFSSSTRDIIFSQCTFAANRATVSGGAFYYPFTSGTPSPVFRNSIFWGNRASGSTNSASATIASQPTSSLPTTFISCIVSGSGGSAQWDSDFGVDGGGNIDADPLFVWQGSATALHQTEGDFRLQAGSPAIDAGLAANLPEDVTDLDSDADLAEPLPLDLLGQPRISGATPDIGANEATPGPGIAAAHPQVALSPDSGIQAAILSLADIFDSSATSFQLASIFPTNGLSIYVDPLTGIVDVTVPSNTVGRFVVAFSASSSSGQSSLYSVIFDIFPDILFVDDTATGVGSGLSWADAIPQVQDALALGGEGYEIWVAEGVYLPDLGGGHSDNDPLATFVLSPGVKLYGGFAGNESSRTGRDPAAHRSILSGDLALDDTNSDGNRIAESQADHVGVNSRTVVTATGATPESVLDGFWITAGDGGTQIGSTGHGGGLVAAGGAPTIRGCRFSGNDANAGGAVAMIDSAPLLIEDCHFTGNSGSIYGGAVYLKSSQAELMNCGFKANNSVWGGALNSSDTELQISSSYFQRNSGERGGAIYLSQGTATVQNSILSGNVAQSGGAIENYAESFAANHCTFTENTAREYSGAVANSDPSGGDYLATYANCIFWNNRVRNRTDSPGASSGTYSSFQSNAIFSSCLIANSGGSNAWNALIGVDGGTNIDVDPEFLASGAPENSLENPLAYQLRNSSPAINAGNISTVSTDFLGRTRPEESVSDMGAFESPAGGPVATARPAPIRLAPNTGTHPAVLDASSMFGPTATAYEVTVCIPDDILNTSIDPITGIVDVELEPDRFGRVQVGLIATDENGDTSLSSAVIDVVPDRLFVNQNATGTATGLTWNDAFPTLQHALAHLVDGLEIWVAQGTYTPYEGPGPLNTGKYANFQLRENIGIYGGFNGHEGIRTERNPSLNPTILIGYQATANPTHTYQIVTATGVGPSAILDGFTITRGLGATSSGGIGALSGGGIFIDDASPIISGCIIVDNSSRYLDGAGASIRNFSSPVFRNCRFLNCSSYSSYGGGVGIDGSGTPSFVNCVFQGNLAYSGSALSIRGGAEARVFNCSFSGNKSLSVGGAIRNESELTLANSIIWNNLSNSNSSPTSSAPSSSIFHTTGATSSISHCLVANSGGSTAWNAEIGSDNGANIDSDPNFIIPADPLTAPNSIGDLQLGFESPALDVGDNSEALEPLDIINEPRITNDTVDLGPYEGQNDQLDTDGDMMSDAFELASTTPPSRTALLPDEDDDFDGLSNQMEFAFGLDPHVSDAGSWPSMDVVEDGGSSYLTISYTSNFWARILVEAEVQRSTDLGLLDDWSTGETTLTGTDILRPGVEIMTERSIHPIGTYQKEFLRVYVTPKE